MRLPEEKVHLECDSSAFNGSHSASLSQVSRTLHCHLSRQATAVQIKINDLNTGFTKVIRVMKTCVHCVDIKTLNRKPVQQ